MGKILDTIMRLLVGTEDDVVTAKSLGLDKKAISKALKHQQIRGVSERDLIQSESEIGSQLFGAIPYGGRREFFNLDPATWIYYDEWIDEVSGRRQNLTLRYEVHHNGILKVKEGARYEFIHGEELSNFITATENYYKEVSERLYSASALVS